jgi:Flp pilus assembly protein TadD
LEDAERVYRYAIERFPGTPALLSNLGTTLMKLERRDEADGLLRSAGEKSDSSNASDDRARSRSVAAEVRVQLIDKKPEAALTKVRETRRQLPERWDLLKLEVEALVALSNEADAVAALQSYLSKHWYSIEAHSMLARLAYGQGHIDESLDHWRKAASLDVWDREPWAEMAKIEAERKNLPAACAHQEEAVERSPGDPMARFVLAKFLGDAGRQVDAAVAVMEARELAAKARP